jgi:hypothetical protein
LVLQPLFLTLVFGRLSWCASIPKGVDGRKEPHKKGHCQTQGKLGCLQMTKRGKSCCEDRIKEP